MNDAASGGRTGQGARWLARLGAVVVALGTTTAASGAAADPPDLDAIRIEKQARAVRIAEPIRLDGVLDEPAWELADPVTDFYQQQPDEFEIATHRTEVRFLYDASTLYVGAILYDEHIGQLIINDLKRDFSGRDSDSFGVILDTFHDRRNSYGFLTNPGGAQREGMAYDNGRRNEGNWHGVWFVRTTVRDDGWALEMAIPFKTLRFPDGDPQQWGLNLVRTSRHGNEVSTWSPVPRQFTHYHMAYAGTLSGIGAVERGRNLQITPFATAELGPRLDAGRAWKGSGDGGVDLKWGVTSSLVLDGSWRTDFSQVEADEQQINLTRFSTFFPEKRQFFLENGVSFQIGLVEPANDNPRRDIEPFFSRRIGLAGGEPVPVIGGARLTGRAGAHGVGLLTMQTDSHDGRPGDNFTAIRLTRTLNPVTSVGTFYFGRESSGDGGFNRVGGVDLRLTPGRTMEIEAFAMGSATGGGGNDWAGRTGFRFDHARHRVRLGVVHVGRAFQHDLGFVRRRGIGTLFGRYIRVLSPAVSGGTIREHHVGGFFDFTGNDRYERLLTRVGGLRYAMLLRDGGELRAEASSNFEHLERPFTVGGELTVGAGDYTFEEVRVEYSTNRAARVSGSAEAVGGEFWNGRQRGGGGSVRLRVNAHFAASVSANRNVVDLPGGRYTADLLGVRLDWSLSPRMFLNAFVQYNGEADAWLSNVRFNLIHRPLSDIYVVWNESRAPGGDRRAIMLKYTHLLAF